MEFEYTDTVYVSPSDLRKMYFLCKKNGCTPKQAICEVTMGWDDCDFYKVGLIENQLIEEINRRLAQSS